MKGHNDTVTSLALSNCGSFVLTNSMDNSLRIWDIRPFVTKDRLNLPGYSFHGAAKGFFPRRYKA